MNISPAIAVKQIPRTKIVKTKFQILFLNDVELEGKKLQSADNPENSFFKIVFYQQSRIVNIIYLLRVIPPPHE